MILSANFTSKSVFDQQSCRALTFALTRLSCRLCKGDSLRHQQGMVFSTIGSEGNQQPAHPDGLGRKIDRCCGGWWFNTCGYEHAPSNVKANLNGVYSTRVYARERFKKNIVINWSGFRGEEYPLQFTEMKLRPYGD